MIRARNIGEYRIIAALGAGGMARVYLGMTEKSGFTKLMVLKVLRPELDDPSFIEMFQKEAQLAARLNHPHVVQTNAFGDDDGSHFMAMEYLEGQSLNALIRSVRDQGGVPLELHARILADALDGLDYAHTLADFDGTPLCIVHRDVSPQNIFVTYNGQAKVLDFGIAKVSDSPRTHTGILKGKVAYMAPEQVKGLPLDRRADVFAMGVMLWEAIANRRMVVAGTEDLVVIARRAEGNDPKIRDVAPDAPQDLVRICDRALAVSPDERYASAAEMRDDLEAWLRTRERTERKHVALLLEQQFSDERSRLRKLVDDQVKNVESPDSLIDLQKLTQTRSRSGVTVVPAEDVPTTLQTPAPKRRARFLAIALAAGAVLTLAAVLQGQLRRGGQNVQPPEPPSASAPSASSRQVVVRLDATPREARLTLDGRPLGSNPFTGSLPQDDAEHELRVEADGYSAETRKIALNADLNVILQLERAASPTPSSSSSVKTQTPVRGPAMPAPPATSSAHAAPTAAPSATAKPKGPLDWKDPWQQ